MEAVQMDIFVFVNLCHGFAALLGWLREAL